VELCAHVHREFHFLTDVSFSNAFLFLTQTWQLRNKVLWEDSGLPFDNVPFVVVNHKVYDCQLAWIDISARKRDIKRWVFTDVFSFHERENTRFLALVQYEKL
jgi:hypothetical protein